MTKELTKGANPLTLYLAGLFDGLGTVKIETPKKGMRPCLYAWITSPHFKLMEILQRVGAHISHRPDGNYRARWKEKSASRMLQSIKPHLSVKKEIAICGIEFFDNKERDPSGENDVVYRLRLKLIKTTDEEVTL
jgi:hypothetical protein